MTMDERVLKATIQEYFYRSGQLRERARVRNGRRHGIVRTWHKNGLLAAEEPHRDGLLHGICRQWNESGKLLGKYRMVHGTGIQRAWHDNGELQMEVSTVRGVFNGRNRIWLRDRTLLSERFYLGGRVVSAETYREVAAKDPDLPRYRGGPAKLPPKNRALAQRRHRLFVNWLLAKRNPREARQWLRIETGDRTARVLGRFKPAREKAKSRSQEFVEEICKAGATGVIVPDIYRNKRGDEFADGLLVRLPRDRKKRKAIRRVCARLRKHRLGAVEPDAEIGETHLYLLMS